MMLKSFLDYFKTCTLFRLIKKKIIVLSLALALDSLTIDITKSICSLLNIDESIIRIGIGYGCYIKQLNGKNDIVDILVSKGFSKNPINHAIEKVSTIIKKDPRLLAQSGDLLDRLLCFKDSCLLDLLIKANS